MNRWPLFGSLVLLLGSLGHLLIVDLSVWVFEAEYVEWVPYTLLPAMKTTTIDWGIMGENNLLNIFSGFSLWMVFSLFAIALYNALVFRYLPPAHPLRLATLKLSLVISSIFLIFSMVCFIYPPVVGAVLACAFFIVGIRKENSLAQHQ